MLPDSFLTELKYRSDIEQVIGGYVQLRRRGRNLVGLCPFHSEKSPSFTVFPENQSFYCFGCQAGGDVITFIRRAENLDYIEAVRFLADRAGMELPEQTDDSSRRKRMRMLEMNREAARWFHQTLMSDAGKPGRAYLAGRGMTIQMVKKFGLGYAPAGWNNLSDLLKQKGYTEEEMVDAGLAGRGKRGGVYDTFRERVMFPIIDLRGSVIGFGGRILQGDGPKYLNSPDTMVFKKSRNLFALNFAKSSKRNYLILCEGYMDVIAMYQAGFDCAIAALGTAFTDEQARLIAQYTQEIILAGDSDGPGQKAVRRNIGILEKLGLKIRILSLTGAKDPDEFIKKFGAERFEMLLEGSTSILDFELNRLRAEHNLETPDGRTGFLQGFIRLMTETPSPVQREVYISQISRELEVSRQMLESQIDAAFRKKRRSEEKRQAQDLRPFLTARPSERQDLERQKYPKETIAGERLIAYLLKNPERREWVTGQVEAAKIPSELDRTIYQTICTRMEQGRLVEMISLSEELSMEAISRLSQIISGEGGQNISDEEAADYIRILQDSGTEKRAASMASADDEDVRKYIQSLADRKRR